MELTGEHLREAEIRLKGFLPRSLNVYGSLVLRNRVRSDPVRVLVDAWPEFRVIIFQPQCEKKGDLFKDTLVFAIDEGALGEVVRKTGVFDWTKFLCVGTDCCHIEIFKAVAVEKDLSSSVVALCHMMKLEDMSKLPPFNSSGVSLGSLDESHIQLVNDTWKFGKLEEAARMIRNMVLSFPSCCVLDERGQPVSWILTYPSYAMGMLYTLPEHRGKGYAKVVVSTLAEKLHAQGYPVYCFIEEENKVSYRLFQSLGFKEDPSHRAAWLTINDLE